MAVSELLFSLAEGAELRVHSKFSAGFNLSTGSILGFAGNKNSELLPYGILLSPEQTAYLLGNVAAGQTVFFYERGRLVLPGRNIDILLRGSVLFGSSARERTGRLERTESAAFLRFALSKDRLFCRLPENLPEPVAGLLKEAGAKHYKTAVRQLFGSGPGLTPAGDDLLLGMMFADSLFPYLPASFLNALVILIERRYTTDVSISNFLCALDGYYCESLLSFAVSVKNHNEAGLYNSTRKILDFGSTSGYYMLLGLYLGLHLTV